MSDFTVLAALFLFVMAGVTLAGYAFWDRASAAKEKLVSEATYAKMRRSFRSMIFPASCPDGMLFCI